LLDRREFLVGLGTAGMAGFSGPGIGGTPRVPNFHVSVEEFGAISGSGKDATSAIQTAVDVIERNGGGSLLIGGRHRCGNIIISGRNVTIEGLGGWLIDGRLTIRPEAGDIRVADLGILETRGDPRSYLMDVSGRNCRFDNIRLVKDPIAGGYQMYLRQPSSGSHFTRLRISGSNGIMICGHDHLFDGFEVQSTMSDVVGGDDAFVVKAPGEPTYNIIVRNGIVRGFAAIVSFGSEIGTAGEWSDYSAYVRNVSVTDITADRCGSIAFFKPGALIYDWRDGLIENVVLERLRLTDDSGDRFTSGVRMIGARGASIRNVVGRALEVRARAKNQGVQPTAGIDISILEGAAAAFSDIDLQMRFVDPYDGARHGKGAPGYPVDHIVRIEKAKASRGSMKNISIDVDGRGTRFGGVYVGEDLDDVVSLRRAHLLRVGLDPPASIGGGGIWSDSRLRLNDVLIDSPVLPPFGGAAFPHGPPRASRATRGIA
jgi:hypothetical protein